MMLAEQDRKKRAQARLDAQALGKPLPEQEVEEPFRASPAAGIGGLSVTLLLLECYQALCSGNLPIAKLVADRLGSRGIIDARVRDQIRRGFGDLELLKILRNHPPSLDFPEYDETMRDLADCEKVNDGRACS
jgi:hypothetical protein